MRPSTSPRKPPSRRRLAHTLTALFVFALLMGPGPGVYLVHPAPGEPPASFLGLPILYAWALGWFLFLASLIVIAHQWLWARDDENEDPS